MSRRTTIESEIIKRFKGDAKDIAIKLVRSSKKQQIREILLDFIDGDGGD